MKNLLLRCLVLTLAVFLAAQIVPGISYDTLTSLVIAGLVLGILNTFLKPILTFLSLPFILVTLGLFLVVVNAVTLKLTDLLVPGFHVKGFWAALLGALIISVVNLFFGKNSNPKKTSSSFRVQVPSKSKASVHDKGDVIDI